MKNIYPVILASFLFTDEKIFTTVAAPKKTYRMTDRMHLQQPRRDAIKRLHTGLTFSHWRHQSASHNWLTVHQFDTCQSRSQDN